MQDLRCGSYSFYLIFLYLSPPELLTFLDSTKFCLATFTCPSLCLGCPPSLYLHLGLWILKSSSTSPRSLLHLLSFVPHIVGIMATPDIICNDYRRQRKPLFKCLRDCTGFTRCLSIIAIYANGKLI